MLGQVGNQRGSATSAPRTGQQPRQPGKAEGVTASHSSPIPVRLTEAGSGTLLERPELQDLSLQGLRAWNLGLWGWDQSSKRVIDSRNHINNPL